MKGGPEWISSSRLIRALPVAAKLRIARGRPETCRSFCLHAGDVRAFDEQLPQPLVISAIVPLGPWRRSPRRGKSRDHMRLPPGLA